jgi:hypothetical protein
MNIEYSDATMYDDVMTIIEATANGNEYTLMHYDGKWRISKRLPKKATDLITRHKKWPERYETLEAAKRGLEEIVAECAQSTSDTKTSNCGDVCTMSVSGPSFRRVL